MSLNNDAKRFHFSVTASRIKRQEQNPPESPQDLVLPTLNEKKEEDYLVAQIRRGKNVGGLKLA